MNDFLQSLRNGQAEKQRTPKTRKNFDNAYQQQYTSGPRFQNYGNAYQPPRHPHMKRPVTGGMPPQSVPAPQDDQGLTLLADLLENMNTQMDALVKNQEYMITVQERTADLLQRQADTIEMMMAHLNILPEMGVPHQGAPHQTFENHYVSSQEPEDFHDGTMEELLKAEREEEERRSQRASQPAPRKRRKVIRKSATSSQNSPKPARTPGKASGNADLMSRDEIIGIIESMRAEGATYDQVAKRLVDLGQPTFSGRGEWHAQTIHRLCSKK